MTVKFKGDNLNINLINEGQGKVIVLLHGWGASAKLYRSIINQLTPHFRVIAPDLPGFGDSTEPLFAYSASDYGDFVLELLSELDISECSFIGHSHGGRTVIDIASRENLPIHINKIVLFDSAGIPAKKTMKKTVRVRLYKLLKAFVLAKPIKSAFPQALDKLQRKFGSADYAASSAVMRQSMVKVLNTDYTDRLKNIKASTLLFWGENDTATPLCDGRLMEKNIPDAGLVIVKNGSHFSFIDDSVLCAKVLKSFFGY